MKIFCAFIPVVLMIGSLTAQDTDTLNPTMEDISYSLGVLMAKNVEGQQIDNLDLESMMQGIEDVLSGAETRITPEKCNQYFSAYMTTRQALMFEEIRMAGEAFLEENGKRPEVITTESGLQYEVVAEGEGAKPTAEDRVTVHYTGKLIDGTVFDSSIDRGEPATFSVGQLISGWTEGLQLMSVGSKYKMFIPQELAYGDRGAGNKIPPFSAILFEVELISIE